MLDLLLIHGLIEVISLPFINAAIVVRTGFIWDANPLHAAYALAIDVERAAHPLIDTESFNDLTTSVLVFKYHYYLSIIILTRFYGTICWEGRSRIRL